MNWFLTVLEVLAIAYLAWIVVCLGVYATLKDRIPDGAWHWKVYDMWYESPPLSDCRYVRRLIAEPLCVGVISVGAMIIMIISFTCCFIIDWIIKPIFFGERAVEWREKGYWLGYIGSDTVTRHWRPKPEYKKFFSLLPLIWLLALAAVLFRTYLEYSAILAQIMTEESPTSFILGGVITLCIGLYYFKETIADGWEKFRERTCRPLETPEESDWD